MYSAPEKLEIQGNICVPIPRYSSTLWKQKEKESADEKDVYISKGKRQVGYVMDPKFNMLFPRMYSSNPSHIVEYENWANVMLLNREIAKKIGYENLLKNLQKMLDND